MATTRKRPGLSAGVRKLGERIDLWRRTRERRTSMPADLWADAIVLARSDGAYTVAQALRLNFEALKRRMTEAAAAAQPSPADGAPASGFVELTGAQILGSSPGGETVVELSDEAGTRLTIRLSPGARVDVAQLISAFRQRAVA